jgi:uncharacterized membrane protein
MTAAERARIQDAMARAEDGTSARVAVRFVPDSTVDALERAKTEFELAGMHGHPERNAALILVAPNARKFALIGDRELHARVGDSFWNQAVERMRVRFVAGDIAGAVVEGLDQLGIALHEHFAR